MRFADRSRPLVFALPLLVLAACGAGGDPPGDPPPTVGPAACDPVAQTGCGTGQKCAWFQRTLDFGSTGCAPSGAGLAGDACTIGPDGETTGYDDCAAGLACVADECRTICGLASGDGCATDEACTGYGGLFEEQAAGVCNPTCDPLTQVRLTDGAEACGSPDPLVPTLGCYGVASQSGLPTRFTCAQFPSAALGKTHRVPALGPAGSAFLNGCEPGYLPLLRASSDPLTEVVCIALCSPLGVSVGNTTGLGGQAPYTCAAAGADGAGEECLFWWWLEGDTTPLSDFSNGLGFCFDHTQYTYDPDSDPLTPPAEFPSCTTLSTDDTNGSGLADWLEFGCGPKT